MFVQASETVLSHKLEECISCDIEILNTRPPLNETTTLRDPEPVSELPSPASQPFTPSLSPSSVSFQADYCPQSATLLCDKEAGQQTTCIINKSYFHSMVDSVSGPQQVTSEIKLSIEPDDLQESCSVVYGYIYSDTL